GRLRGDRVEYRERPVQLVSPLDRHRLPALGLDRRPRNGAAEAPDARGGQVAVEPVRGRTNAHGQPAVALSRDQPRREWQGIDERRGRSSDRLRQGRVPGETSWERAAVSEVPDASS